MSGLPIAYRHLDPAARRRLTRLTRLQQQFRGAMEHRGWVSMEDFLPPGDAPDRALALLVLIATEQERRFLLACPKPVEAYLDEWPELRSTPPLVSELVEAECRTRGIYATCVDAAELESRFPELAESVPLDAIASEAEMQRVVKSFAGTGRFFLVDRLGAGGMGVVYRAFDRDKQTLVALKVLPRAHPHLLSRFKKEFRGLAEIAHPHLVQLDELFSVENHWFFTMELVEGVHFLDFVRPGRGADPPTVSLVDDSEFMGPADTKANSTITWDPCPVGPPDDARLRSTFRQLVVGLNTLHAHGKLHRDIKPSNVLVRTDGNVVILDFGLVTDLREVETPLVPGESSPCEAVSSHTDSRIAGTLGYMSPEQASGDSLTPASDWYAVGVMLHEALYDVRPRRRQSGELLTPEQRASDVPDDLGMLCTELLAVRPEVRPTGDEILRRLDAARGQTAPGSDAESTIDWEPANEAEFVGRQTQLDRLQHALQDVLAGAAVTLHISGPSGMGKTRLLQHFLKSARASADTVILQGRCFERESVPHKALDNLVDSLVNYMEQLPPQDAQALLPSDVTALARVFPVLNRVPSIRSAPTRSSETPDLQEVRWRAMTALRELFARISDRHPLLVFIDDLHWGDVDSAAMLTELLRPPHPPRMLLLVAYRSEDADENPCLNSFRTACRRFLGNDDFELRVDALAAEDAELLALRQLKKVDAETREQVRWIAREARGLPIFVCELVRTFADVSGPRASEGAGLTEIVWRRIQALPANSRRLIEIVAVAGRPLCKRDAYDAVGSSSGDRALASLQAGHLVRTLGPGIDDDVEVFHDLIRDSVLKRLDANVLKSHHRRLATSLEHRAAADPETIGDHFYAAAEFDKAGHYYQLAAEKAAETLAFDLAARLYQRALDLQPEASQKDALQRQMARAMANAGRTAEAADQYRLIAINSGGADLLELHRNAAYYWCVSGRIEEGRDELGKCLRAVGMQLPRTPQRAFFSLLLNLARLRLRGLHYRATAEDQISDQQLAAVDTCWEAAIGLTMMDTVDGAAFQARNLLLALNAGEPYRLARALSWQASHLATQGVAAGGRTRRLLDLAETLLAPIDSPHANGLHTLASAISSYFLGHWKDALAQCDQAEAIFRDRCTGVAWEVATARSFALWSMFFLGQIRELSQRLPRLLRDVRQRGDVLAEASLVNFSGIMMWLASDNPEQARQALAHAMRLWIDDDRFRTQHFTSLAGYAQVDIYDGRGQHAWQRLNDAWPQLKSSMLLRIEAIRIFMLHLRARAALAAMEVSPNAFWHSTAAADAKRLERENAPWARPLALLVRAGLAHDRHETAAAAGALESAAAQFDQLEMHLFAQAARRQLGHVLSNPSGAQLLSATETWFAEQQIVEPDKMARLCAPGFARLPGDPS